MHGRRHLHAAISRVQAPYPIIFNSFFGGFGGGARRANPNAPRRGSDTEGVVNISFEEAAKGCKKTISFNKIESCPDCGGTGAAKGTSPAPHAYEEKDHEFCCAPNGFSGLETSLAAVITNAYGPDKLSIDQVVYYMSTRPAELMHLDAGVLEVGKPADITVFSTTEEWTVDRNKFYTKGKVSPFDGMTVTGKAKLTVVDGKIVMKEGVVL